MKNYFSFPKATWSLLIEQVGLPKMAPALDSGGLRPFYHYLNAILHEPASFLCPQYMSLYLPVPNATLKRQQKLVLEES